MTPKGPADAERDSVSGSRDDDTELEFSIRLLIRHPTIDPEVFTKKLGLTPHLTQLVGTKRMTPMGNPIPGFHNFSIWSYWVQVGEERHFFASAVGLIDHLENRNTFVASIATTGGSANLIFGLQGSANIGDTISFANLARLAKLKINLGIEVFL